jgi:hypothetical protein
LLAASGLLPPQKRLFFGGSSLRLCREILIWHSSRVEEALDHKKNIICLSGMETCFSNPLRSDGWFTKLLKRLSLSH